MSEDPLRRKLLDLLDHTEEEGLRVISVAGLRDLVERCELEETTAGEVAR